MKPSLALAWGLVPPAPPAAASAAERAVEAQLPMLRRRLLRQARLAMPDAALAEDLVQDTLIAVVHRHAERRGEASLTTWAGAILKNKIADWYRSPACRRLVFVEPEADGVDDAAPARAHCDASGACAQPVAAWQQPENQAELREMVTALEHCVERLPQQARRVFLMREWLGFETAEICLRIGLTAENCRTVLHRARMSLRGCMARDWAGKKANA